MSVFDAEISVVSATIGTPSVEAIEAGTPPHLELGIIAGLALPFPNPNQPDQPVIIPIGKFKFAFGREQAIELFGSAVTAAKDLPEEVRSSGKLMVAQSMSEVERAAHNIKRATGQ